MHLYTDGNTFPDSISEIDDSDPPNAANENTPIEGLANRTRWLRLRLGQERVNTYLAAGSTVFFLCPANVKVVELEMCGGAGAGGGGGNAVSNTTNAYTSGGGGGGGALLVRKIVSVTPGQNYAIYVGRGGLGVAAQTVGGDGEATTFKLGAATLATAAGGQGGYAGSRTLDTTMNVWAAGGAPVAGSAKSIGSRIGNFSADASLSAMQLNGVPSHGGAGVSIVGAPANGNPCPEGFAGGNSGLAGATVSLHYGGGPGGGGGAGPFGNATGGADGGAGTAGAAGLDQQGGFANDAPLANTGAGSGGGGGAGFAGSGTPQVGGATSNGGSGRLTIKWTDYGAI